MKKILPLALFSLIVCNSCVLLFMPKKQKLTVSSSDTTSKIYVDGELKGSKSATFKTNKDGIKQVRIVTPGHKDNYSVMIPNRRQPGYWACITGDILFTPMLGLGLWGVYMDPYLAKGLAYQKTNKFSTGTKYPTKSESNKFINVTNVSLELKDTKKDFELLRGVFDKFEKSLKEDKMIADAEAKKVKTDAKAEKKRKRDSEVEEKEAEALKLDETVMSALTR